jgi:3-deoxy-7-phosphoheptulonate synthase
MPPAPAPSDVPSDPSPETRAESSAGAPAPPDPQRVTYPDPAAYRTALAELRGLPPLVSSDEVECLRHELAEAAEGRRLLLQGGDCAERFEDCASDAIAAKLKILLQMGLVLEEIAGRPTTIVGRIAGQYAKPRSALVEQVGEHALPAYRGDLVNGADATSDARQPDPRRLLRGYARAGLTLNFIRALLDGGFGDPSHPDWWRLHRRRGEAIADLSAPLRRYEALAAARIDRGRRIVSGRPLARRALFTSHEALHLDYERAQTREVPRKSGCWNLCCHLPWLGARTGGIDGPHASYLAEIENPIGIKVAPWHEPATIVDLLERLDPRRIPGRIVLIHRLGVEAIADRLPPLVAAVESTRRRVLWCVDPMHGNTRTVLAGRRGEVKTRRIEEIVAEIETAFAVHRRLGTVLAGLHVELTGEPVTECLGGVSRLDEGALERDYRSPLDPRLNDEQSIEVALVAAEAART